MSHAYFFCGLPCSGKSTLARAMEAERNALRLSLDEEMRRRYSLTIFDDEYGQLATQMKEALWVRAQAFMRDGGTALLDWSLWSRVSRAAWSQRAIDIGVPYTIIYLDVPIQVLRARLEQRNRIASPNVHEIPLWEFDRFTAVFEHPSANEGLEIRTHTDVQHQ